MKIKSSQKTENSDKTNTILFHLFTNFYLTITESFHLTMFPDFPKKVAVLYKFQGPCTFHHDCLGYKTMQSLCTL